MFAALLDTDDFRIAIITVTCGSYDAGLSPPDDYHAAGYSDGTLTPSSFGSRSPTSFPDHSGNARTILGLYREDSTAGGSTFVLFLNGLSIPNTDATFERIVVNGTSLDRSDASYAAIAGGAGVGSVWVWSSGLPTVPDSGSITVGIHV